MNTTPSAAWRALEQHRDLTANRHLRELFCADPQRGERFAVEACGVYLDYSKNRIDDRTLELLVALAEEARLRERIDAMFRGDRINSTENRAVLHVALRAPREASIVVDGVEVPHSFGLKFEIGRRRSGDKVKLTVVRDGQEIEIEAELDRRQQAEEPDEKLPIPLPGPDGKTPEPKEGK